MSNEYYDGPPELAPGTKARSVDINQLSQRVDAAFDKLPDEVALKGGTVNYAANTGTNGSAYKVQLSSAISKYTDGLEVKMRPVKDNTGACTLNVNGIGNIAVKRADGTDPQAGDILGNTPITLMYQAAGNVFYLPAVVNSQIIKATTASTDATASAAAAAVSATTALKTLAIESANPPENPIDGQEWIDATSARRYTWVAASSAWAETFAAMVVDNVGQKTELSILTTGASTELADNGPAIQAAVNALAVSGGVVIVPPGRWKVKTAINLPTNVSLRGSGINVAVLDYSAQPAGNWINVAGTFGASVAISALMDQFATACSTLAATGAAIDDDFILLSQRNALSPDAGEWQLGNGTENVGTSYFSEVLTVSGITNALNFTFTPPLVFPGYRPDKTQETDVNARASATVQKATWAENIHISGLTFIAGPNSSNAIDIRRAKNCMVHDCKFVMGEWIGTAVTFTFSYRCTAYRCSATHTAQTGKINVNYQFTAYKNVSSWYCGFTECEDINGSQCFDTSFANSGNPSMYCYVKNCLSVGAKFNAATCHSGNYAIEFSGNHFIGCVNGPSIRSRASIVKGNTIVGGGSVYSSYGVYMGDGWSHDSIIEGNIIEGFANGVYHGDNSSNGWGKINTRENIIGNTFRNCKNGVRLIYAANRLSAEYRGISIVSNKFFGSQNGVQVDPYVNGVAVRGNDFFGGWAGGSGNYGIYFSDNSVDSLIAENRFFDIGATSQPIRLPGITDLVTFPVATYPNHGFEVRNNRAVGLFSTSGGGIKDYTGVQSRVRTWVPAAGTVASWERAGTAIASLTTDDAGSAGYYFGNSSDQTRAGITWNNGNSYFTFRSNGAYVAAFVGTTMFRTYTDLGVSLGSSAYRWLTTHTKDLYIYPSANQTPTVNGQLTFELTSDVQVKIKVKGSDGVVRSASLALA